jgi:hypothetical protein
VNDKKQTEKMQSPLSNTEIVALAVYLLGGDTSYQDTEDIAKKANELAPGRFIWKKYPDQINIDNVRKRLSDAKNPKKKGYLLGSFNKGWILTEKGVEFSRKRAKDLDKINISRAPIDQQELLRQRREKARMLASVAFEKASTANLAAVTIPEAEAFFRLDEYIKGEAREKKLVRLVNAFSNDPDLGKIIKKLAEKVRENDRNKRVP